MKVKICSILGDETFEMDNKTYVSLMKYAFDKGTPVEDEQEPEDEVEEIDTACEEIEEDVLAIPDSIYDGVYNVKTPKVIEKRGTHFVSHDRDGYKGFLYMKCPVCGEERGYCTKTETKTSYCKKCKMEFKFGELLPMHVHCQCGSDFKYRTNMTDKEFVYECLHCSSPVHMRLNTFETAYVTDTEASGAIGIPDYVTNETPMTSALKKYGAVVSI